MGRREWTRYCYGVQSAGCCGLTNRKKQIHIISAYFLILQRPIVTNVRRSIVASVTVCLVGDHVAIGFLKVKFAIPDRKRYVDCAFYEYLQDFSHVRTTTHFAYLTLGHEILTDNSIGRRIISDVKHLGGKITRIDFAVDVLQKFDLVGYKEAMVEVWRSNPKKPPVGLPALLDSPNGTTVYIGKRSSSRMLRAYDKRAEIKAKKRVDIGFELTRFEIEVKRERVEKYVHLFMSGNTLAILQDLAARYRLPWLTDHPKRILPKEPRSARSRPLGFVARYKKILFDAWCEDSEQFLDIIGANNENI